MNGQSVEDGFWLTLSRTPMSVRWMELAGTKTRVLEFGDNRQNTLILLHGTGGHAEAFVRNIPILANRYHVVTYDLPGHGWSETTDRPFDIDDYCAHLRALVETLSLKRYALGGLSLGGWIAARYAGRYSSDILSLILIAAGGQDVENESMKEIRRHSVSLEDNPSQDGVRRRLEMIMGDPGNAVEELVRCRTAMYSTPDSAVRMKNSMHLQQPEVRASQVLSEKELALIRSPTLVVTGDRDPIIKPERSLKLSEIIPGAEFVELPVAGHWPQFEQPALMNDALQKFLNKHSA